MKEFFFSCVSSYWIISISTGSIFNLQTKVVNLCSDFVNISFYNFSLSFNAFISLYYILILRFMTSACIKNFVYAYNYLTLVIWSKNGISFMYLFISSFLRFSGSKFSINLEPANLTIRYICRIAYYLAGLLFSKIF